MIAVALDVLAGLVEPYGVAVLFVVFVLEGALIGKLIPTRTLFVGVALTVGTGLGLAAVVAAAVTGATVGQCLLFLSIKHTDYRRSSGEAASTRLSGSESSPTGVARTKRWLDRWGLPAVALSNALPVVRGSLTIPIALSQTSAIRFATFSLGGTALYVAVLAGVAVGIDGAMATVL